MFANRDLQAKITGGPNVWSAKREEQINFGTPAPNSSDGQQLGQSRLIFGSGKPREIAADTVSARSTSFWAGYRSNTSSLGVGVARPKKPTCG